MQYRLHTLVDITNSKQYRNEPGREQARGQQQNFDTMINTIGMRSNLQYDEPPRVIKDIPQNFGLSGKTAQNIWIFDWRVEMDYTFSQNGDPCALLKKDFVLVPYIANLTETIDCTPPMWVPNVNISFEMIS